MHALIEECEELAGMAFEGAPVQGTETIDVLGIMAQKERVTSLAAVLGVQLPNSEDEGGDGPSPEDDDQYGLFQNWNPG